MQVRVWRLPVEVRDRVIRLAMEGWSYPQITAELRVSAGSIANVLSALGGTPARMERLAGAGRLSLEDRVEIRSRLDRGLSMREIGRELGWDGSTISREVAANGGAVGYRPVPAHRRALKQAHRVMPKKLSSNPMLLEFVVDHLRRWWSPEQIARRLRHLFPDEPEMWVSHETIYQSLYVQGRGELRRELAECLRTGRARRRSQAQGTSGVGKIPGMVLISERPAEIEDRAVVGHWEGDLILGMNSASAVGTLVERATRFVMLIHLPNGRTAEAVRVAMAATILTLPVALRRSITWDQGTEMAQHRQFRIDTGIDIYFCDPHSPWQRGSNENTNGLLRQYMPKSTDLSVHSPAALREFADNLNGRPRKTLGWMTPSEKFAELVDALAP